MKTVLKDLACEKKELSILFTDDAYIAELNDRYLGRHGPTNVLAFPMSGDTVGDVESRMLGDVVVSVDTAIRESGENEEPLERTICRLLIHGILHLLDYNHERSPEDELLMEDVENRLLSLIGEE